MQIAPYLETLESSLGYLRSHPWKIRTKLKQNGNDEFRYISFDNTVPTIVTIKVRHSGNLEDLGDKIMIMIDSYGIRAQDPIIAPDLADLVFVRLPDEE